MVEVKTGPFICACWAKCILGSQSGGIAPDCAAKARETICGGKCHHVTPPCIFCIFLSLAGTLPCPSVGTLYICFSVFSLSRSSLSSHSSCPFFCHSNQLLLTAEAFLLSALSPPQQSSKCYPHELVLCLPLSISLPVIDQVKSKTRVAFSLHSLALSAFIHPVCSVLPLFLSVFTTHETKA